MADTDAESVRTESQAGEDPFHPLTELSPEQLRALIRDTSNAVSTLKAETEVFEKFCKRLDAADLTPAPITEAGPPSLDFSQMRSRRRSKSRSTISERLFSLSVEQKCELVQRELEESKEEARKDKENADRLVQSLQATMEEAEIRRAEIKKATYEFERDIGRAAVSRKTGTSVAPDKILRYLEEKTRARDSLIDKLRLKNASLKVHKKKLQMQLKQEEMGEVLHEVDFQQLKIENAQFLERIDERNQDLLHLKLTTGDTLQVFNSYKKKLQNSTMESCHLDKEISTRSEMLRRIECETHLVEQERQKAENVNKKLRRQLSDYRVPDVLQYVQEKMEQDQLQKTIRVWERKAEIAQLSLNTRGRAWEQLKGAGNIQCYTQPAAGH
ncbi:coiled-coil domain-containing protein 113 isoform X2 [Spea bombifrons]|uniref:coiled-coil domain-containing protein 113 isoform X2 n=1 Tax=Spea bombifrons TaxID=233779 RepID=UPI00234BDAFA|nr:coiled-coil domain-containing protein 113 isoform X2 [Spea bombifrons]